jgi:hypothetical protein
MAEKDCDDCQKRHEICSEITKQKAQAKTGKCIWKAPDPHEPKAEHFEPIGDDKASGILNDSVR